MNDIFLGIWRNIDCFDESKGSFLNWAAGVARLEAIDTLRKVQREQKVVPLEEIEILQEDTTWSTFAQQELSKETEEILKCLSPKDRELFRRVFLDEEEPEEEEPKTPEEPDEEPEPPDEDQNPGTTDNPDDTGGETSQNPPQDMQEDGSSEGNEGMRE